MRYPKGYQQAETAGFQVSKSRFFRSAVDGLEGILSQAKVEAMQSLNLDFSRLRTFFALFIYNGS